MIPDDAMLMAYADGELDALTAKRVERAIAADPSLADVVAAHRALRERLGQTFGAVSEEPVPARFAAMLASNVTPLPAPSTARPRRWIEGAAIAASLVLAVAVGHQWQSGPVRVTGDRVVASGSLGRALDTQLASASGDTRMLASFRDDRGSYCRVFATAAIDGIACRDQNQWVLRETRSPLHTTGSEYRQAGSADAPLMASAQDMMKGDPLDASAERRARDAGWR
ncbi:MAG: anti-sigma factor [Sphingomonas sp.]